MKAKFISWLISLILVVAIKLEAQTIQTLCSFNSLTGQYPEAALTLGNDGIFYGTTVAGGSGNVGTVFKVTTNGTLTTLISFNNFNGATPYAGLTLGNDGKFYGTTFYGGSGDFGTVFQSYTNVGLTTLVSLNYYTNGSNPYAGLTLGNDGSFYGTTSYGGITNSAFPSGMGTIFKMTTNGALTKLVSFNSNSGANPYAALTIGNDGNFYGTTKAGGITNSTFPSGMGTVFKFATNGTLTTLVSFNYANGANPHNSLTLGNDGNFYGTTPTNSGSGGYGTVFQVTTSGTLSALVSFNKTNGASPNALTLGNDGNFYGTTTTGGSGVGSGAGTVFKVTTNGALTTVMSFNLISNFNAGAKPMAGLTLGGDNNFYGTTTTGGDSGSGTVFRLLLPPDVTIQPQSQTNNVGTTVSFLVGATSLNPLNFQWQKNGTNLVDGGNIFGSTNSTLVIASVSDSDNATYSVIVSNAYFGVESSNALLTVVDSPVITAQPPSLLVLPGTNIVFGASFTGSATFFSYQWQFNGTNILNATNVIFAISSVATNDAGFYSLIVTNLAGSATSSNAVLAVVLSPSSLTNNAGSIATFTVTTFSPMLLGDQWQWQKNGTILVDGGNISGSTNSTLTVGNVADSDAGIYSVILSNALGIVTSFNATLTVIDPPVITQQPLNRTNNAGSTAVFAVSASGTSPTYQWFKGSSAISGAVTATLTLTNVQDADVASYAVVLTNAAGSVTSAPPAILTVIDPPVFTLQPMSRTNNAGSIAMFTVTATGTSPAYQWFKGASSISGAVTATLTLTNVQDSDVAGYTVVLTNAAGSVTSSNAVLTVIDPPVITAQPTNLVVLARTNVAFGISLTGSASLFKYQWQFNGTNILSATNAIYAISSVATNNAGFYSLTVTNLAGTVTSSNAALSVVLSPASRTNYASSTATFTTTAFSPETLNLQWQKNGANLVNGGNVSGATNSTLTVANVQDADAAVYSAIVSDATTSVTTSNAVLTVNDTLVFATQPQSQTNLIGSSAAFNATAYGVPPFVFQWYFNNAPVGSPTSGTNYSAYTITNVGTNQAGNYTVQVVNGSGNVTSSNAVLTIAVSPVITTQPLSRTNNANTTATFSVTAASVIPLSYQWQQNSTNLVNGGKFSGATNSTLTITAVSSNEATFYSVIVSNVAGSVTSSNATLTVIYPPSIAAQPASLLVLPGTNVAFGLSLNGNTPFAYNWRFNGTNIPNATNATYAISSVLTNNAGNYSVAITNVAGSVTSSVAALTVLVSPTNLVKTATSNAIFTVVAFNPVALVYQWQQNGTNLVNGGKFSGATGNTLTITGVSSNEAAIYAVTVTNTAGNVTSSNATLTVIYPPVFTTQPLSQRVVFGNGVAFNVAVSGTAPFNYQWRFNAGNLLNATNVLYAIPAVDTNNTGNYSVVVTNLAGSMTSSNALLVVLVPPALALQFSGGYPLLNLNGMVSNNFVVQYNTDLTTTNWITLQTFSNLLTSPYPFLDPAGIGQTARFYRVFMQ